MEKGSPVSHIVMTVTAAPGPHARWWKGQMRLAPAGTAAWSRTHLMPRLPAGLRPRPPSRPYRPARSVLNRPKTPGKASNIPDQHVDLQYQPNAKCSAVKIGFASLAIYRKADRTGGCSRAARREGSGKRRAGLLAASAQRHGRDRKSHSGNDTNETVLWRQACSQLSSGTWSRRSAAPSNIRCVRGRISRVG